MTIQRLYSLPNCTLVLDGMGDGSVLMNVADTRPLMSMLINAECRLVGKEPLSGGREFFESLVQAVSRYVQEVLSGVHPAQSAAMAHQLVKLQRIDANHHRLSVEFQSPLPEADGVPQTGKQISLSTVELFDLVEAIDQFLADGRTLPDLGLSLKPVTKRAVSSGNAMAQQVVPAAVGLSGLAAAAIAFALIPAPKIQEPAEIVAKAATTTVPSPGASPAASPSPATSPSPAASAKATIVPGAGPDLAKLESQFSTAPEIKDAAKLEALRGKVASQLDAAWKDRQLTETASYRLGVGEDGAIVGYKAISPSAAANAKQTPLADLPYNQSRATTEPLAQFKVDFTPDGKVNVSPWSEATTAAAVKASPGQVLDGAPLEITDAAQLKALQPKLYDQMVQGLAGAPKFPDELVYRLRLRADGTIADYLPSNQSAKDRDRDLPVGKLAPIADEAVPPKESLAWFKAVIKPNGALEVSPWRGMN